MEQLRGGEDGVYDSGQLGGFMLTVIYVLLPNVFSSSETANLSYRFKLAFRFSAPTSGALTPIVGLCAAYKPAPGGFSSYRYLAETFHVTLFV